MTNSTPYTFRANEVFNSRCAGQLLAEWLRDEGHDVVESRELGPDPGDRLLLEWASRDSRILVTIDTDFGELIFLENSPHCGLVRLPDVPSHDRQLVMQDLLTRHNPTLRMVQSSLYEVAGLESPKDQNSIKKTYFSRG